MQILILAVPKGVHWREKWRVTNPVTVRAGTSNIQNVVVKSKIEFPKVGMYF